LTAPIVCTGYGSKSLLTCGIPYLKFNVFVVHLDGFESEVNSDGGQVVLGELALDELDQDGGFAYAGVSDYDGLVEIVELFYHVGNITIINNLSNLVT